MRGSFYTRGGDDGFTGLLGEGRVPKEDARMEAIGAVDEAGSALGVARALAADPRSREIVIQVQRDLYGVMAELAATPDNVERFRQTGAERVAWLEQQIASISEQVDIPKEFILPGDTVAGAFFDLARTAVRRAERRVSGLLHSGDIQNQELLRYLNRLSSLCFLLELYEHAQSSGEAAGREGITLAKTRKKA